jgi:RNA polymerase sigma-70 factor, ECF subfamily
VTPGSYPAVVLLMNEQSDAQLVARILGGDVESFGVLFQRYRDTCTRFAVRMLGSRSDADDVLQTAFMRAYRNLSRCREPDRFGGWLYQIVVNECRTFASRQRRRELRFIRDPERIDRAASEPDEESSSAMREYVEQALAKLPVEQREAFLLKYVEEMSYEEIAETTGVGVSALKMRVKRACDTLRDLLEGVYHE